MSSRSMSWVRWVSAVLTLGLSLAAITLVLCPSWSTEAAPAPARREITGSPQLLAAWVLYGVARADVAGALVYLERLCVPAGAAKHHGVVLQQARQRRGIWGPILFFHYKLLP